MSSSTFPYPKPTRKKIATLRLSLIKTIFLALLPLGVKTCNNKVCARTGDIQRNFSKIMPQDPVRLEHGGLETVCLEAKNCFFGKVIVEFWALDHHVNETVKRNDILPTSRDYTYA
jgi:hypothetical protein